MSVQYNVVEAARPLKYDFDHPDQVQENYTDTTITKNGHTYKGKEKDTKDDDVWIEVSTADAEQESVRIASIADMEKKCNKARADFAEALKDVRQLKQSLRGRSEEVRAYFIEYIKEKELMMYQLRRVLMRLERAKIELEEDGDWVERWECGEA